MFGNLYDFGTHFFQLFYSFLSTIEFSSQFSYFKHILISNLSRSVIEWSFFKSFSSLNTRFFSRIFSWFIYLLNFFLEKYHHFGYYYFLLYNNVNFVFDEFVGSADFCLTHVDFIFVSCYFFRQIRNLLFIHTFLS